MCQSCPNFFRIVPSPTLTPPMREAPILVTNLGTFPVRNFRPKNRRFGKNNLENGYGPPQKK